MLTQPSEKEVRHIRNKRNDVWYHLALIQVATTLMLMRHHCVGDDGIGNGAKFGNFCNKISKCGGADGGGVGGRACSTAAQNF